MTLISPIHTEKTECQDCYKCLRNCPTKAIRVEAGRAAVVPELCIACGICVGACPVRAKRIRDDLAQVRIWLAEPAPVLVSLAPSFASEFGALRPGRLIRALKRLGFAGVSETALGAQEISGAVASRLRGETRPRLYISSACPSVVELLTKHFPEYATALTDLLSPMLAHARLLRQTFKEPVRIVFIGPCAAKKKEVQRYPEMVDAALTFADLRGWLEAEGICPQSLDIEADDGFVPRPAREGGLYPIDGGMNRNIELRLEPGQAALMTFSGLPAIKRALRELDPKKLKKHLFLELLACEGGCVNGPGALADGGGTILKRQAVQDYVKPVGQATQTEGGLRLQTFWALDLPPTAEIDEATLRNHLREVGKFKPSDELNCGGCGYESCRDFARALAESKAERTMCVSYMRKLAQSKANALLKTMPSGVVIVDRNLRVVESNRPFAELLGEDAATIYQSKPGMEGASLSRLAPALQPLFSSVLESGREIIDRDLRFDRRILRASLFSVEPHYLVGGVLQDITQPAVQRGEVIRRAREVINKNLRTVQEIACLLGENAAESEIILESIVSSFSPESGERSLPDHLS